MSLPEAAGHLPGPQLGARIAEMRKAAGTGAADTGRGGAWKAWSPTRLTLVIWACLAAALLVSMWSQMRGSLVSQDDAMRLVELRAFLHGRGWFDLTEPRLGFPPGYLTHWSRLVDAPLAGLVLLFSAVAGPALSEDAARAIWPLLLLLPVMLSVTAISGSVGGRAAAARAALLGATCVGGLVLFRPGFIHHHNAQMALAAAFVALSFAAPRSRAAATAAGAVGALALGVGLESLAILGVAAAGYALRFVADPAQARNFTAFSLSTAVCALAVFVATVPSNLWSTTQCDAFAGNSLVPVVVAGLGAALAARLTGRRSVAVRLAALSTTGAMGFVAYAVADPSCLKGPFGHIDPNIWPLWLSHVAEMRSVPRLIAEEPVRALVSLAWPIAGLAALAPLWRGNRSPESLILGAILIVASIVSAIHVRGLIYANWFAVPVVAAASGLIAPSKPKPAGPAFRLRPFTFLLAGLLVAVGAFAALSLRQAGLGPDASPAARAAPGCSQSADYADLARLPSGVVLPHVDLGPYVLATTAHHVLVAPYHRLQKELSLARRLLAGDASSAEAPLRQAGVDYLVDCRGEGDALEDAPGSLRSALMSGQAPSFLEPLTFDDDSPVLVWRVRPR